MLPRSTIAPFLAAFVGFLFFFWISGGTSGRDAYISFALDVFNISAIIGMLVILYSKENSSPEKFGNAIRENISTFLVALLVNMILGFANIWEKLAPLIAGQTAS